MSEPIIMYDSPEAARPYTAEGWVSSKGYFFLDESIARYDGCTHQACRECGAPARKAYLVCDACLAKDQERRFLAKPTIEWDGQAMLYSDTKDRYYSDPDDAEDDLEDGQTLASLRLVVCVPQCARRLEVDDFIDELPDDEAAPDELLNAIYVFNAAMEGKVLSWVPGPNRLEAAE